MISPERLEAIVRNELGDGRTPQQIARRTGVPLARVQLVVHKLNGTDPAAANRETRKKKRQERGYGSAGVAHRRERAL